MGFYGNITYNTYGLQNESVKPEHLDRPYWQYITSNEVVGIQGLRQFLGLETVNNDEEGQKQWEEKWAIAEQRIYKFYLPDVSENTTLRKLLGNGMLLGWVRYINDTYALYVLSLGNRTGQIFRYTINPYENDELPSDLLYDDWDTEHTQAIDWLLRKTIVTSQIKDQNITTNKIAAEAVTTAKIDNEAVTTEKIANKDVTPSKLDRDYWERAVWSSIESYTDLFQKCTAIPANGTISDTDYNKGTLYIVKLLQLSLPIIYTDSDNKSTFLIESNEKYNFGQCFVQNNDNIITIMSGTTGQVWTIERVTVSSEETITENGIYYKPILKQVSTPQVADRSISTIKIAHLAVTGGIDSTSVIDGYTVTSYNIEPYTITGEADENHCNIAEKTITAYNIADNTITQDKLKDIYARCHYGKGYPDSTVTEGLIDSKELQIGDLYVDINNGLVYTYKGYNFYQTKHEWISYLTGGKGTGRPKTGNIGDIWVDSNTGKVYIYQENKVSAGTYGWSPIQTYQDTQGNGENMDEINSIQLHYISNEQSLEDETGLYTNIKNILQATSTVSSGIFIFTGDGRLGEDSGINRIVFNNYDSNTVFVGTISSSEGGRYGYHNMTCFCTTTGELFKLSLYHHDHAGLSIAISPIIGPSVMLDSEKLYTTTVNGTLAFDAEHSSLLIYIDGEWKQIQTYSSTDTLNEEGV